MRYKHKLLLFILVFFLLNSLCRGLTDDFSTAGLLKAEKSAFPNEREPSEEELQILNQPYYYLSKGKQAFVFASQDGEYVIKLLRPLFPETSFSCFQKKWTIRLSKFPFARLIASFLAKEKIAKQKSLDFQSYKNAINLLQEETKVVYLHLAKGEKTHGYLEIYDKIGVKQRVNLDTTCFLLQKKTKMFYPTLLDLVRKRDSLSAKALIHGYINLEKKMLSAGIINPSTIAQNIGCIALQPVQIDVGRLLRKEDLQQKIPSVINGLENALLPLRQWLTTYEPSLLSYIEEVLKEESLL